MFAKVSLVPGSARQTEPRERVFRGRLRADREGKRARLTRRERLREGREATLPSDEHRATGAASGEAPLYSTESPVRRRPRAVQQPIRRTEEAPQLWTRRADRRRQCVWHGQPGQRERHQGYEPGFTPDRGSTPCRRLGRPSHRDGGHRPPVRRGLAPVTASRVRPVIGSQRASPAMPSGTTGDVRSSEG
jgi:hypothetical protein